MIFMHQKFCEPHLADHPFLKKILTEIGIPQVQLELDGEGLSGQIQTRLEGFFEMLEAG
jgi:benzoyl-CoA reductase/2-hydroxyglutaryl-CoA dehydratase subunit BcrC/BadD/HgdB